VCVSLSLSRRRPIARDVIVAGKTPRRRKAVGAGVLSGVIRKIVKIPWGTIMALSHFSSTIAGRDAREEPIRKQGTDPACVACLSCPLQVVKAVGRVRCVAPRCCCCDSRLFSMRRAPGESSGGGGGNGRGERDKIFCETLVRVGAPGS